MPALPEGLAPLGARQDFAFALLSPEDRALRGVEQDDGWVVVTCPYDQLLAEAHVLGWRFHDEVDLGDCDMVTFRHVKGQQ